MEGHEPVNILMLGIWCRALAKWTCTVTQVFNLGFISPPTGFDWAQIHMQGDAIFSLFGK